jgi:oligogalacturonide lyase
MGKGTIRQHTYYRYQDTHTGREIIRLTSPDELSHHPYFYNKIFTNDSHELIYAAQLEGERNLYRLNMTSGLALQLTEGSGVLDFSANLSQDDRFLYFCRDKSIVRLEMDSLQEEVIYMTPSGWSAYDNPGLSLDGQYLVTVEMDEAYKLESHGGWSVFEAQWAAKPRCRIVRIHIATRRSHVVHEEHAWLGHPQLRPGDNETIMYCHEGPAHKVDARIWLVDAAGNEVRCARPQQPGEMISHEYWLPDGSRAAYVYRIQEHQGMSSNEVVDLETYMPKTENAHLKEQIMMLDPDTLVEESVMECSPYCHFISNADYTFIAGDGQSAEQPYIYLADLANRSESILCAHHTSWKSYGTTQDAHPHPAFTPDSSRIVFTSDRDGLPAIYMIELE